MAMSGSGQDGALMADINVTPLVDVMLVLLVIFMITTPMLVAGMQVDLPRAEAPPLEADGSQLILSVDADGNWYIEHTPLSPEQMQVKLAAIARANPDQDVFLKADGSVPYQRVASLIATAKRAGIPRVGLVTRPEGQAR